RVRDPNLPAIEFLVLDFGRVTGLDSSAVQSFAKVLKLAEGAGFRIVLTGLSAAMRERLAASGLDPEREARLVLFPDVDHGMQWCEEQVLDAEGRREAGGTFWAQFGELVTDARSRRRLMKYFTRMEVGAGKALIRQGEPATEVFFIESGRVTAQVDGDELGAVRLRTMGPGTVVGELPVYLGTERSASVVAEEPSVVYELTLEKFRRMEVKDPDLAAALHRLFARLLAQRLVDSQRTTSALMD
ncbi:MAG TPA: cyclic nucleotide-binding domain-containing protein, partial [Actinomycetota bacterium]